MSKDERYYQGLMDEYSSKIAEEKRTIESNIPTVQRAEEVLAFHLEQLRKRGATLEDSVAEILRGVVEQAKAKERIPKLMETLEECQSELESSLRDSLREQYKDIETLDRLLTIDDKGVFWLYKIEDGKKGGLDECLGRNDDKTTLDILPLELHKITPNDIARVKVVKEVGSYKRRKVTKQVFIDADFI